MLCIAQTLNLHEARSLAQSCIMRVGLATGQSAMSVIACLKTPNAFNLTTDRTWGQLKSDCLSTSLSRCSTNSKLINTETKSYYL